MLSKIAGPEVMVAFEAQERADEFARDDAVAGLEAGGHRLGKSHGQDDMGVVAIETFDAGHVQQAIEAQLTIGGIFEDEDSRQASC